MQYSNKIFNCDCADLMNKMINDDYRVDLILTSPPYNNSRISYEENEKGLNHHKKYDVYDDMKSSLEYIIWINDLFVLFDKILVKNGVILWNASYQAESNEGLLWRCLSHVIEHSNFTIVDKIVWKKSNALPITQRNKLSKICEDVFVFSRKDEFQTFNSNKEYIKTSHNGQKFYKPIVNFIEAKNNDGKCPFNSATFSSELVVKLLNIYAKKGMTVYDPFMGSGTTALGCKKLGLNYVGSELSENQCKWAEERLNFDYPVQESESYLKFFDYALF